MAGWMNGPFSLWNIWLVDMVRMFVATREVFVPQGFIFIMSLDRPQRFSVSLGPAWFRLHS